MDQECCDGCGRKIDNEVCWCGEEENAHTALSGHMFVPMGCVCLMDPEETKESQRVAKERSVRLRSIERAYHRIKAWNDAYMDAERKRQNHNRRRPLSRQEEGVRSAHQRLAALLKLDDDYA